MIRKRHIGPVRDHVSSAAKQLQKIADKHKREMQVELDKLQSEIEETLKDQPDVAKALTKHLKRLERYTHLGLDQVIGRDLSDATEKLEYAYELAAENGDVDVLEQIKARLDKAYGDHVTMVNNVAMVPAKVVQTIVQDARSG